MLTGYSMKVSWESWGFQGYAQGLAGIEGYRESCWKTGEQVKGAVPRLPQLALTALCFIVHSKLFFEKGHIF